MVVGRIIVVECPLVYNVGAFGCFAMKPVSVRVMSSHVANVALLQRHVYVLDSGSAAFCNLLLVV